MASSIASLVISWNTMRFTGTLRLQHLEEVPRDRLALAVLVGREVQLARVLQRRLELGDDLLLVVGHHVDGREVVVDVDAEPADLRLGDVLRRVPGAAGKVADVTRCWP